MSKTVLEAGIRDQRLDSYIESEGTLPAGGTFSPFSNVVKRFSWTPDAGIEARRGIGGVDPVEHDTGLETHTATIAYLLQGTIAANTPLYEAFSRDSDQLLAARTIVQRELHHDGGSASNGVRTYVVLEGCKPASAKIPGDPGSAGPIEAEITYTAERGRSYEISQPSAASVLVLASTEAGDAGATITVQSDDNATQEAVVLTGTNVTTTASFTTLDAIELATDIVGTLTVTEGPSGATLVTILGSNSYGNSEGDFGVPVIPTSGTRVAAATGTYEKFLGDTITYGGGDLAFDINSAELSVDNSVEVRPINDTRRQRVIEGNRTLQLTATVLGETEYQDQITRHLTASAANIVWTLTNSVLTLAGAALVKIGDKTVEAGQAYMQISDTFEGTAITIA